MSDEIESPAHYNFGQMQAWDIIELAVADLRDPATAYHVASALKYLLRASRKNGDKDVAKACAHLKREVARHAVPEPRYDPRAVAFNHPQRVTVADCIECADWSGFNGAVMREAQTQGDYGNPITPGHVK